MPGGIGQQQSNGMPPKPPVSDGTPNTSTPNLANTKEKTPMCLVNELARFNKVSMWIHNSRKLKMCMTLALDILLISV